VKNLPCPGFPISLKLYQKKQDQKSQQINAPDCFMILFLGRLPALMYFMKDSDPHLKFFIQAKFVLTVIFTDKNFNSK